MSPRVSHRRLYRRVHMLPSLITLGNFACGFLAIALCLNALFFAVRSGTIEEKAGGSAFIGASDDDYLELKDKAARNAMALQSVRGNRARADFLFHWACVVIFFGMIFDMLDGKVARHMGADSAFGKELDSLADVTTFGIAPAIIVNTITLAVMPVTYAWWTQTIIFGVLFAVCAVLRLARYNIQSGTADKNIFSGLPSPAAAGCVVSAVLLLEGDYRFVEAICGWLAGLPFFGVTTVQVKARLLSVYQLIPGLLMVSSVPFTHVANRYLTGKKSFTVLVLVVLLLATMWQEPRLVLFVAFNGYLALGLVMAVRSAWGRGVAGAGEVAMGEVEDDE